MHVRLVTWDDDPPAGGQGVVVRGQREALLCRGVQVSTTAGRGANAIKYPRLSGHGPLDMSIALNLSWHRLLESAPDLAYVSGGPGGLQFVRRLPVPIVYLAHHTFRQSHERYHPQRAYGLVEALGYRRAAHVVAVSQSTADSIMEMRVPAARITVISPGIDTTALQAPSESSRIPGRMVFLGRLRHEKGVLDAVAAMGRVISAIPDASGIVIGAGPLEADVRRAVASTGMGRISFLGQLEDDEVAEQLWRSEVVLVPSAFEGLGLVALEAMAAGVAVVGYDVVGLHDTIGDLGRLVPHGDVSGLAREVQALLADDDYRRTITSAAVTSVRKERSWSANAAALEEVFRSVLDS